LLCDSLYKSLASRWKGNPRLKLWFNGLTDEERADWYIRHRNVKSKQGQKRDFDVAFEEANVQKTGTEMRNRYLWKPFRVFKRSYLKEHPNAESAGINVAWKKALMEADISKVINGELHLGEYIGVLEDGVDSQITERKVRRTTAMSSGDDLSLAMQQAATDIAADREARDTLLSRPSGSQGPRMDLDMLDNLVSGVGMPAESFDGLSSIARALEEKQKLQAEADDLDAEDLIAAEEYHKNNPDKEKGVTGMEKIEVGKALRAWIGKIDEVVEPLVLEGEQLAEHASKRAFASDADIPEFIKESADGVTSACKETEERAKIAKEKMQQAHDDIAKQLAECPQDPIGEKKQAMIKIAKDFIGTEVPSARKKISGLRSMLTKAATTSTRAARADKLRTRLCASSEGHVDTGRVSNFRFIYDHTYAQNNGEDHNVDVAEESIGATAVKHLLETKILKNINGHKGYCEFIKTFAEQSEAAEAGKAMHNMRVDPVLHRWLKNKLCEATPMKDKMFERVPFVDTDMGRLAANEMSAAMFDMQAFAHAEDSYAVSPQPYGLPFAHFVISGSLLFVGVKYQPGAPLHQQIADFQNSSGDDLAKVATREGNFYAVLKPGHVLCIPKGFIVANFALQASTGLRWGIAPPKGECTKDVQLVCASLCDSYPSLRATHYGTWLKYLTRRQ